MFPHVGIVALAALVPIILGFIYYHPKVMGKIWMKETGLTEESLKGANMALIFGISLLMSFMLAIILFALTVHQTDLYSLFAGEKNFGVEHSSTMNELNHLMDLYGDRFRTFKHGAFHGVIIGIFLVLPVFMTNSLFERKSFKYTFVNVGYWILCFAIMGGIMCQWG